MPIFYGLIDFCFVFTHLILLALFIHLYNFALTRLRCHAFFIFTVWSCCWLCTCVFLQCLECCSLLKQRYVNLKVCVHGKDAPMWTFWQIWISDIHIALMADNLPIFKKNWDNNIPTRNHANWMLSTCSVIWLICILSMGMSISYLWTVQCLDYDKEQFIKLTTTFHISSYWSVFF